MNAHGGKVWDTKRTIKDEAISVSDVFLETVCAYIRGTYMHTHPYTLKKNEWQRTIHMFCPLLLPCILASGRSFHISINLSANLS